MAAVVVTPLSSDFITLLATDGTASETASFTAQAKSDILTIVTSPGATAYAGDTSSQPFTVKLTAADGITPVAGSSVLFSVLGTGGVSFGACGAATCTVRTDSSGFASSSMTAVAAGDLTLLATPDPASGAVALALPFLVQPELLTISAQPAPAYLSEGTLLYLNLGVLATRNGLPALNRSITWSGSDAVHLSASTTSTGTLGVASVIATVGPLAATDQANATACFTSALCTVFSFLSIPMDAQQLSITGGAQQTVTAGSPFNPVQALIADPSGHPIAGASVGIYETVIAATQECPSSGRCPAAEILATHVTVLLSDSTGHISFVPLSLVSGTSASPLAAALSTHTEIALTVGNEGFASTVLFSTP